MSAASDPLSSFPVGSSASYQASAASASSAPLPSQSTGKEFKEYKWFNSLSIPLEVQVAVSRLELPKDMHVDHETDFPKDIYITASLVCNQMVVNEVQLITHTSHDRIAIFD